MAVFVTAEAWSRDSEKTWRLDDSLLVFENVDAVRATMFWSAPLAKASLRAEQKACPNIVRRNTLVALLSKTSGVVLEADAPPEISLFSARTQPLDGFSGAGVFPRCLFGQNAASAPRETNSGELDHLLGEGQIDEALELFGALCLEDNCDAIGDAARRIAIHLAVHPLLRTDRVGMFAAALASLRS